MGYLGWPNKALTRKSDLRPNWSPKRAKNVKGEKKRRGRGRRRRGRRRDQGQKGMDAWILVWKLNSSMDLWNSKAWFS